MDFQEIKTLNRVLPNKLERPAANKDNVLAQMTGDRILTPEDYRKFYLAYNMPYFGWQAADMLFQRNQDFFPTYPSRTLNWVYRAVLLMKYPNSFKDDEQIDAVKEAYALFTIPANNVNRRILEAALITHESAPRELGKYMGMNPLMVEAYDALFFNVFDRKADHMFLRNVVYPKTRLEEYLENYLNSGTLESQLCRIGYNKDLDNVLFFAGFRTDILKNFNEQQAQTVFKRAVMLQGMLLAENGFLNFSKQHPSVVGARNIVQSGLIGGGGAQTDTEAGTFTDEAYSFIQEVRDGFRGELKERIGF